MLCKIYMAQTENKVLMPNVRRNPEHEFPKKSVTEYLISETRKLKELYGDLELFVSRSSLPYQQSFNDNHIYVKVDWKTGASVTTTQLIEDAYKIASQFKRRAYQPGEVILCLVHSDVNYFSFLLATWMSGCVLSSLQHSFSQGLITKSNR